MKRHSVLSIIAVGLALMLANSFAIADPIPPGTGGNTLVAYGPNNLTVNEAITSLGGGIWEYEYSFTSDEPDNIWLFFVYTSFSTFNTSTTTFPHVSSSSDLNDVYAAYDARNVDPTLTDVTGMWFTPYGGPGGLAFGVSASLTFQAIVLDTSPKLFAYETDASGYVGDEIGPAGSIGQVAAIGYTNLVPESSTLALAALGLLCIALLFARQAPPRLLTL